MVNLRFAADYLLYRLRAKTRHGTHSPFVYRLVDKVIYDFHAKKVYNEIEDATAIPNKKLGRLLYRLVADWQPNTIVAFTNQSDLYTPYLQNAATGAKFCRFDISLNPSFKDDNKLDCILINAEMGSEIVKYFEACLPKVHERTMMIIPNCYRDEHSKQAWAKIKADPRVTVTIDLFFTGLVYFRKGQVKEDFTIRF